MKAAVFGLGKSGRSACHYLKKQGYEVLSSDDRVQGTVAPTCLEEQLGSCEFLLISPGISLQHRLVQKALSLNVQVFCDIEYAFQRLLKNPMPVIGITGTNGKTTTTLLTCHLLNQAGLTAKSVGNVGVPILDEIEQPNNHLVVELSSFQLQTTETAILQTAALLNISPNHLDHHSGMDEYVRAKQQIGQLIQSDGPLFLGEKANTWPYPNLLRFGFSSNCDIHSDGEYLWRYGAREERLPESLRNNRSHDAENFLAAYALCRHIGLTPEQCVNGYESFKKPPHRIQFIREHAGITYYNDSKASNVDAVIRAVETLQGNIVLIAGGVHKGFGYHAWKEIFADKVHKIFLIGQAAPFIEQDLAGVIPCVICSSLEEAVQKASASATAGDKVLLSPGCSSFDMFANYEERGKAFETLVNLL